MRSYAYRGSRCKTMVERTHKKQFNWFRVSDRLLTYSIGTQAMITFIWNQWYIIGACLIFLYFIYYKLRGKIQSEKIFESMLRECPRTRIVLWSQTFNRLASDYHPPWDEMRLIVDLMRIPSRSASIIIFYQLSSAILKATISIQPSSAYCDMLSAANLWLQAPSLAPGNNRKHER